MNRWFLFFLACALGVAAAFSQETMPPKPPAQLTKDWEAGLARAEKALARPDITDDRLAEIQSRLTALRLDAQSEITEITPKIKSANEDLAALGPPPPAGDPPEAANIAERRKTINDRLVAAEGNVKEAELIIARADRLLDQVSALKRLRFTERIMARGLSPLSPAVWQQALPEIAAYFRSLRDDVRSWLSSETAVAQIKAMGWHLPTGVLIAILLAWPLRLWLLRRFGYISVEGEPSYGQRLRAALFTGIIRTLLPSAAVLAIYLSLRQSDLLSDAANTIAWVTLVALVFVFFATAFCWAALAPTAPSWRLIPITDHAAVSISRTVTALAAVFGIDWVLNEINNQVSASIELVTIQEFLSGLAIAALLFALLRRSNWDPSGGPAPPGLAGLRVLRLLLGILVCAIPLSACFGYVALSRLLATQLVQSAGLFVLLVLLCKLGDEMIDQALSQDFPLGLRLRNALALTSEGSGTVAFWLKVLLRLVLLLAGLVTLPLLWGAGGGDISAWLYNAFFGFSIGPIKISLADVVWAGLLFGALLLLTRLLQRALDQQVFPRTPLDAGLRHSIRSAVGYVGVMVAAVLAVSSLGIDLSNLALIAGALSVGIGLGLQNIVNNFVSGLILLIERPIKVGDWIVVGSQQGYVKKISVRATELSTFDRASVFIPNSELIANAVMNRTYPDPQGRVIVPVGIAYGSDTQKVKKILTKVAEANADVLSNPPPLVLFRSFGDSALQFEVVAYISDVNRSLSVTSDLCFAIDEAFVREGIEFPFPQRDVQLRFGDEQWARLMAALRQTDPFENVS